MATTKEQQTGTAEVFAPRTYMSAWQWNENRTATLMTAEEWLEEEATVYGSIGGDSEDDGPDRAGILRAIAHEIATLRREKTEWAEECTRHASAEQSRAATVDAMQADVAAMLRALGLSDHARPESPHGVIHGEILPAIAQLRAALVTLAPEAPAHAD